MSDRSRVLDASGQPFPLTLATQEATPAPELREVAPARDSDEFIGLWVRGIREATDPILRGRGGDLKFYDQVRADGQVWSTLQQRRDAVVSLPWRVEPGADDAASEEAAEVLRGELEALDWNAITRQMHWGVFYGYAVAECLWEAREGRICFGGIRVRRARRFGFNVDGELMLRQTRGFGSEELMPERKFWVMSTGADTSDEPYGLGLAHLCYWPVYFKRSGLAAWMVALDKYASPTAYGKFPPGSTEEEIIKLLSGLRAIRQDSALVVPDSMDIGYLQTSKSASIDYEKFDGRLDAWISKIVLSQTMTTDDGSSLSQSSTHMDVRDEVRDSDVELLNGSFNRGPAAWWTEWNYGDRATPPNLVREVEEAEDLDLLAERDVKLYQVGFRPTRERVEEVYGSGYELVRAGPSSELPPPLGGQPAPELAEDEPDAIGAFVDRLVADGAAATAVTDVLAPIVEAIEGASSLEETQAAIASLSLGDDELEPLQEILAQAVFAARIGGEVGADHRPGVTVEEM